MASNVCQMIFFNRSSSSLYIVGGGHNSVSIVGTVLSGLNTEMVSLGRSIVCAL